MYIHNINCFGCTNSIRHLLIVSATKALLNAFVLSKLDYCNSHAHSGAVCIRDKLQRAQNSAERLMFQCSQQNHISPLPISLHWLPIMMHINCQISVICHSIFLGLFPYLLIHYRPLHQPGTFSLLCFSLLIMSMRQHFSTIHSARQHPQ